MQERKQEIHYIKIKPPYATFLGSKSGGIYIYLNILPQATCSPFLSCGDINFKITYDNTCTQGTILQRFSELQLLVCQWKWLLESAFIFQHKPLIMISYAQGWVIICLWQTSPNIILLNFQDSACPARWMNPCLSGSTHEGNSATTGDRMTEW